MKRLIKSSDAKIDDQVINDINTIEMWVVGDVNSISNNEIDEIIERNKDCIYSGTLYRILNFYGDVKTDDPKSLVQLNDRYQSFTKSYDWIKKEIEDSEVFHKEEIMVIKCSNTGLDINKFINKYNKLIIDNGYNFQMFGNQNEVISKLVNNFEIIYTGENLIK